VRRREVVQYPEDAPFGVHGNEQEERADHATIERPVLVFTLALQLCQLLAVVVPGVIQGMRGLYSAKGYWDKKKREKHVMDTASSIAGHSAKTASKQAFFLGGNWERSIRLDSGYADGEERQW